MASIRLEDEARQDPRFKVLGKRLGTSRFDARARMEELWAYCTEKQTYYLHEEIIDALSELDGFHQFICDPAVDLAEKTDQGIRIKGTLGRIEWLAKLRENGKKGGRPKSEDQADIPPPGFDDNQEETRKEPEANQKETRKEPEANQEVTKTEPTSNPLILTLTPTIINKEEIQANAVAHATAELFPKRPKFKKDTREKMRAFIAAYSEAYKKKYQHPPEGIRDKALVGKIGHWLEHVPEVRALSLVEVYLQISYRPFDENFHDLWQFFRHLNRIGHALDTGRDSDSINWTQVFNGGAA